MKINLDNFVIKIIFMIMEIDYHGEFNLKAFVLIADSYCFFYITYILEDISLSSYSESRL